MEYCLFQLHNKTCAVPLSCVREVLIRPIVTPVPLSAPVLAGITGFRGEVLPVFSIDSLLPGADSNMDVDDRSRILVLAQDNCFFGVFVDQVSRSDFANEVLPPLDNDDASLTQEMPIHGRSCHFLNLKSLHNTLETTLKSTQEVF